MAVSFEQLDTSGFATTQDVEDLINDNTPSANATYSSQKINNTYLQKTDDASETTVTYETSTGNAPASGGKLSALIGWLVGKCGQIGTLTALATTAKDTLVNAINEIFNNIGNLTGLDTADKTSVVGAINELVERINNQDTYIDDFDQRLDNEEKQVDFITGTIIGDRDNLGTTDKSSIVSAINEVNEEVMTGSYTIPQPSSHDIQNITITTGKDMRNAYIAVGCMDNTQTDVPQFLITSRTQTGFSFNFLPGGTSKSYDCQWIAVF